MIFTLDEQGLFGVFDINCLVLYKFCKKDYIVIYLLKPENLICISEMYKQKLYQYLIC